MKIKLHFTELKIVNFFIIQIKNFETETCALRDRANKNAQERLKCAEIS